MTNKIKVGQQIRLNEDGDSFNRINLPHRFMNNTIKVERITKHGNENQYSFEDNRGESWYFIDDCVALYSLNWKDRYK
jgi:hypothetical protein